MKTEDIKYLFDLGVINAGPDEERMTVTGNETTVIVLIPPKGCGYTCDFCAVKHIVYSELEVLGTPGAIAAISIAKDIDQLLAGRPEIQCLKLSNAGNPLYGQERGAHAELHDVFWSVLLSLLKKHDNLKVLEIEVRIDEFIKAEENVPKEILQDRVKHIAAELKEMNKSLRLLVGLEYVNAAILSSQGKFSRKYAANADNNYIEAFDFFKTNNIEWLGYAMLGGRFGHRSLTKKEAVTSAAETVVFGLTNGAREIIVNSQYLVPPLQQVVGEKGVHFFVPTEDDILATLKQIYLKLDPWPQIGGHPARVRITTDKEDVLVGAIGPDVTEKFRQLMSGFNNAVKQKKFFEGYFSE